MIIFKHTTFNFTHDYNSIVFENYEKVIFTIVFLVKPIGEHVQLFKVDNIDFEGALFTSI